MTIEIRVNQTYSDVTAVQLPRRVAFVSSPNARAFRMPDATLYQFPSYHEHTYRRLCILRYAIPDMCPCFPGG